jgi:hypothetical protein
MMAALAALLLSSLACTTSVRSIAGTAIAPVQATWESRVQTRIASGVQTSQVEIPQTAVALGKTQAARLATKAPGMLTPQRPGTGYQLHPQDILIYNVDRPIRVREAAYRFSTSPAALIEWNQPRYASIVNEESRLETGWRIIIFFGNSGRWDLVPTSDDSWNNIPGCGGTQGSPGDGITCGEVTLEFVSDQGWPKPECMPSTLKGEYSVRSRYQGPVLYRDGVPFIYGVYWDAAKNQVVMGPGIIRNRSDVPKCGY